MLQGGGAKQTERRDEQRKKWRSGRLRELAGEQPSRAGKIDETLREMGNNGKGVGGLERKNFEKPFLVIRGT